MSRKIGRNDPCPCGSRSKYKKCCLRNGIPASSAPPVPMPTDVRTWGQRVAEAARRAGPQRGMLVPSTVFQRYRFRAVRSTLYWNRPDQTFHEFLLDHLRLTLGKTWYFAELDRPAAERHQV